MIIFTGAKEEISIKGKILGLSGGYPDIGESPHSYIFIGCYSPKKGQFFIRPSGKKNIVNVALAECDHKKHNYPILNPLVGDAFKTAVEKY